VDQRKPFVKPMRDLWLLCKVAKLPNVITTDSFSSRVHLHEVSSLQFCRLALAVVLTTGQFLPSTGRYREINSQSANCAVGRGGTVCRTKVAYLRTVDFLFVLSKKEIGFGGGGGELARQINKLQFL
jgi:hypothetical protein